MTIDDPSGAALTTHSSRRSALHAGSMLLGGLGAIAIQQSAGAQATPIPNENAGGLLLVQSFSQGSMFPTQGDVGVLPYTVILWDAADRGFFIADRAQELSPGTCRPSWS